MFNNGSTELSRICGVNNWRTALDSLWDEQGNVIDSIVNEKQVGTIVYTTFANPNLHFPLIEVNGGRRGSVQVGLSATTTTSGASGGSIESQDSGSDMTTTTTATEKRGSMISTTSSSTAVESGNGHSSELKHRKKGGGGGVGSSHPAANYIHLDLRQARSAAGLIYRIDRCILFSKQLTLERRELELPDNDPVQIAHSILCKKRFPENGSPDTLAAKKLQYALVKIAATHQLAREINQRANTKYDSTNPAHERNLIHLWELMRPQEKLEGRYTTQWTDIGFQGKDPATDFRGMGMLGLDDLVYYAKYYPISSKNALECSHDPISWYSYAIVGINITAFAVQTLRTRHLQYYLFLNGTDRSIYHELYCYLFHRFNEYWTTLEPKPIIMDFERVFADFKIKMERQLARRKLMMLRADTKENLGSQYTATVQQDYRKQQQQLQSQSGEEIELDEKNHHDEL
ncbi:hypothetical protein BGZ76_011616 [Entomortierella beljakovae]|nr:hypothetical protein BGZ76_011616 [Entomortierella beljakovae]